MGLNYYWQSSAVDRLDPKIHLGKTAFKTPSGAQQSALVFQWAHDPAKAKRMLFKIHTVRPDLHAVVDEAGRKFTAIQFLRILAQTIEVEDEVGERFS